MLRDAGEQRLKLSLVNGELCVSTQILGGAGGQLIKYATDELDQVHFGLTCLQNLEILSQLAVLEAKVLRRSRICLGRLSMKICLCSP